MSGIGASRTSTTEIEGMSILVTGGGTGIGAGIAHRLATDGAWVTICGRTKDTLQSTAEALNGARERLDPSAGVTT